MELRVLTVGDVVGQAGLSYLSRMLRKLKREHRVDFCIVNGENTSMVGMTPRQAEEIFDAGADVITLGNHVWNRREIVPYLEESEYVLRPANLSPQVPGLGWNVYETAAGDLAVIDLVGRCGMDFGPNNPFLLVEQMLKRIHTKLIFVEIHAEATSEKLAMGYMLDGKVSAVYGTHTHVPTADLQILPNGTGYVTDLGMTGPRFSVLGVNPRQSIATFRGELTSRYEQAQGPCKLEAALFTVDSDTGRTVAAERILVHD
ncbi:MAG: TIGR00282 family metallophosphoesterase [Oscillospiraceae bacterium]|nr:TIGR00282 family metallophosphoesterase [Oscillospiraceae bacterium]